MSIDADSARLRTIAAAVLNGDCPRDEYILERRRLLDLHTGESTPDYPVPVLPDSVFEPAGQGALQAAIERSAAVPRVSGPVPAEEAFAGEEGSGAGGSAPRPSGKLDLYIGLASLLAVLGLLWGLVAWLWG